jgi:hypothetical protein
MVFHFQGRLEMLIILHIKIIVHGNENKSYFIPRSYFLKYCSMHTNCKATTVKQTTVKQLLLTNGSSNKNIPTTSREYNNNGIDVPYAVLTEML